MKKIYMIALLAILGFSAALAQENAEAINKRAEAMLNRKPSEALILAEQAKLLAETEKNSSSLTKAIALMGVANYKIDSYKNAEKFIQQAIALAEKNKDTANLSFGRYWSGNLQLNQGQYGKALDAYQSALTLAEAIGDQRNIARCLDGKATIYESLGESKKAEELYKQSLAVSEAAGFVEWEPNVIASLANMAHVEGKLDVAIERYNESIAKSDKVGNINNKANCYQQLAYIYYTKRDSKKAMEYVQMAMNLFQETGSMSSFSYSRLLMSTILLSDKEWDLSIGLAQESLEEGRAKNVLELQKKSAEMLYYAHLGKGDKGEALKYHVLFHELSEKSYSQDLTKKLTQLELQANFDKQRQIAEAERKTKEAELNLQIEQEKLIKKASLIGAVLLAIIASLAIFAFIQKQKDNREIANEKRKSDDLLLNILPAEVAQELKDNGKAKAKNYDLATVLFADIKNFTGAAENLTPEQLVNEIDFYFKNFDEITSKYKIEKIKTIGDAYLCVGGLPIADKDNAIYVVKAALEIQQFMRKVQQQKAARNEIFFEIRIGIHTGPLIAGIVGLRKFAYDIWGDTVNIAARMEQHGVEGKINITGSTYALIQEEFECTYRGKIDAKNKGQIDMYFVEGLKSNLI
jgi:adenylate cyclase